MHDINPALSAFTNAVRTLYGNRLERIVLFGSFARGTAHEGSDIDVAVVSKGSIQAGLEIDQMSDILFEVNSINIPMESKPMINKIVSSMKKNKSLKHGILTRLSITA